MPLMPLTWKCHICGEERPDRFVSVFSTDVGDTYGLPAGTMMQNVRYCNDKKTCGEKARTFNFADESRI